MSDEQPVPVQRSRNRNWLWVFAALAVLAILAISINWVWNASQPLTPEKLKAARELWAQKRPTDYDLKITKTVRSASSDGASRTSVDKYEVQVRGGRVVDFRVNGREPEPFFKEDGTRNVVEEQRRRENYDMDGLFDSIEEFMAIDQRDNRKSFLRARFDESDGHLMLFTRQIEGRHSPHLQVELKRLP